MNGSKSNLLSAFPNINKSPAGAITNPLIKNPSLNQLANYLTSPMDINNVLKETPNNLNSSVPATALNLGTHQNGVNYM